MRGFLAIGLLVGGCRFSIDQTWRQCGCSGNEICVEHPDGTDCVQPPAACGQECGSEVCEDAMRALCEPGRADLTSCGSLPPGQAGLLRLVVCGEET